MDLSNWIKIRDEEYEQGHPPDFMTHFHYVECLKTISDGLNVECKLDIQNKIQNENHTLKKKINLIKLIKRNLDEEYKTIEQNLAFAEVCVPWIAVKSYYLMFNLLMVLDYLISTQELSFNSTHDGLLKKFKNRIENQEIIFNKKILNTNFQCHQIVNLKVKSGSNLKIVGVNLKERILQVLKKLISYKIEDFQRKEKFKNFRSKKAREKRKEFLENNSVNMCEFFYWYRIKSNYRDLEFLDKDIDDKQFRDFYKSYFELTSSFYEALKKMINVLSKTRLSKEIL
jgi:hypothetical protein